MQNLTTANPVQTGITEQHLKTLGREMLSKFNEAPNQDILIVKPARQWMDEAKLIPIPNQLFGPLWYEGELCVLFADSNKGKSLLAVQIANSICNGIGLFDFEMKTKSQRVMYLDFELSTKQFQQRYSEDYEYNYEFHPDLIRGTINNRGPLLDGDELEDALKQAIIEQIIKYEVKIIVVDNLTYLTSEAEKSKEASGLMKFLKRIKEELNLSILVLAHTPKREETRPLSANDCQGSKMLGNFSDSSFAIGKNCRGNDHRYIKQIKVRMGSMSHGADNVISCLIEKRNSFTEFVMTDKCPEVAHLKKETEKTQEEIETAVIELHSKGDLSLRDIGDEVGISHMTVKRILKKRNKQ